VTIEPADDARLPVTFEGGELGCKIDGLHCRYPVMSDDLHPCRLTFELSRLRRLAEPAVAGRLQRRVRLPEDHRARQGSSLDPSAV
jgi:hypothetical protein